MLAGEVPEDLRDKRVVELSVNSLVAGTQYRGQFEERVKQLLDEISAQQEKLILFIDELHTIVGAGSGGGEGGLDVANSFKPMLARGELHLIGATTLNEYQKHIEKDAALERRFQPVLVSEPTVEQTITILRGLRDTFEAHHKVTITDEAIVAAAELSDRYIRGRYMPDKAIDVIDQAAARVRLRRTSRPAEVMEADAALQQARRERDFARTRKDHERTKDLEKRFDEAQAPHFRHVTLEPGFAGSHPTIGESAMLKKLGIVALMLTSMAGSTFAQGRYYDGDRHYYQQNDRNWNRHERREWGGEQLRTTGPHRQ